MKPNECLHELLKFGSGHYYLFCQICHTSWVLRGDGDQPSSGLDNPYHYHTSPIKVMDDYRYKARLTTKDYVRIIKGEDNGSI